MKNNENNNSTEKYRMGQSTGQYSKGGRSDKLSAWMLICLFLPEMFSTGFVRNLKELVESADSETLHWMKRIGSRAELCYCRQCSSM